MGRKSDRICSICKCTKSYIWRQPVKGKFTCRLCSVCPSTSNKNAAGNQATRTRSSRGRQLKARETNTEKSRRSVFKKNPPQKAPAAKAKITTVDNIVHKQELFQSGDIVSVIDLKGKKEYGQIQRIVIDMSGEKSAHIIWLQRRIKNCDLIVTHPDEFICGKQEQRLRKLDSLDFVIHAPPKYYEKYWEVSRHAYSKKLFEKCIKKDIKKEENGVNELCSLNSSVKDISKNGISEVNDNSVKLCEKIVAFETTEKSTDKVIENCEFDKTASCIASANFANETDSIVNISENDTKFNNCNVNTLVVK